MDVIKEKDILLEKMLDPGATLTDAELRLILADEDLREIHEVSAAVRGASIQPVAIDVEKEWRLFRHKIHPKPTRWRWAMRVAAIFLGVLFVSAIVKVGIDRLLSDDSPVVVAEANSSGTAGLSEPVSNPQQLQPDMEESAAAPEKHPKPLAVVEKLNVAEDPTEEEEVDVDEYLRLQQARIDNDLAILQAELYIEELLTLNIPLTSEEDDKDPESLETRYVIMQ